LVGFLFFRLWDTLLKLETDAYDADGNDPYVSPLLHKKLGALPKVYVAVAGQDTLRDDGRLLKAALDGAGYVYEASYFANQ
jgi:acetyl esterase/lipase